MPVDLLHPRLHRLTLRIVEVRVEHRGLVGECLRDGPLVLAEGGAGDGREDFVKGAAHLLGDEW